MIASPACPVDLRNADKVKSRLERGGFGVEVEENDGITPRLLVSREGRPLGHVKARTEAHPLQFDLSCVEKMRLKVAEACFGFHPFEPPLHASYPPKVVSLHNCAHAGTRGSRSATCIVELNGQVVGKQSYRAKAPLTGDDPDDPSTLDSVDVETEAGLLRQVLERISPSDDERRAVLHVSGNLFQALQAEVTDASLPYWVSDAAAKRVRALLAGMTSYNGRAEWPERDENSDPYRFTQFMARKF